MDNYFKIYVIFCLSFFNLNVLLAETNNTKVIKASQIKSITNMAKFELIGSAPEYIVLDCQSFLNHLSWAKSPDQVPYLDFFLYSQECWDIAEFVHTLSNQGQLACIEVNFIDQSYRLFSCDPQ